MSKEDRELKIMDGLSELHSPERDLDELDAIIDYVEGDLFKTGLSKKVVFGNRIIDFESIISGGISIENNGGWGKFKVNFDFLRTTGNGNTSSGQFMIMYFQVGKDETRKFIESHEGKRYLTNKIMEAMTDGIL